jgi:hypothetical protein
MKRGVLCLNYILYFQNKFKNDIVLNSVFIDFPTISEIAKTVLAISSGRLSGRLV